MEAGPTGDRAAPIRPRRRAAGGRLLWFALFAAAALGFCWDRTHILWSTSTQSVAAGRAPSVVGQIPSPRGFSHTRAEPGSFAEWLARLPLKPGHPPVYLYNGQRKRNQAAHYAVLDLDIGDRDLQQCADAVIRLRAEYLYATRQFPRIHFNFTSGDRADFVKWAQGYRPIVTGSSVSWVRRAGADDSPKSFRAYLDTVFSYAGTRSLAQEIEPVSDTRRVAPGDVFIEGGSPGHAVIVVATAENARGRRVFLLAQGYMPAQDIHILKNPTDPRLSPWYKAGLPGDLVTPEWAFPPGSLKRFPGAAGE